MAKRIIKETCKDGTVQYRVETNKNFFGFRTKWHTCKYTVGYNQYEATVDAIFNSLEDAEKYCGIDPNPIINREIVRTL